MEAQNVVRVIIAGSREFDNYQLLEQICDELLKGKEVNILCGMARGTDMLGFRYAKERGYKILKYFANWNKYGMAAGPIRNKEMANNADMLVAFWDEKSKGTKNMINIAKRKNLKVIVIKI